MAHPEATSSEVLAPPPGTGHSQTNRNLWAAFLDEAKARAMYQAYALRALEEGHPEVADVFVEVAGAETVHALEHLRALGEVGSSYENLTRVIEGEMREASVMYPRMIRQADAEGRPDASRSFRLAFEGESRHARLFQQAIQKLEKATAAEWQRAGQAASPAADLGGPPMPPSPQPAPLEGDSSRLSRVGEPAPAEAPGRAGPIAAAPSRPGVRYEEVQAEKQRVAGLRRIREVVFGAQDGLISTVAIAATVMAATQNNSIAVVAGVASVMAGTISMAAGTYLGARAASQMEEAELEIERRELAGRPEEERAELIATFRHDGYSMVDAEDMADRLMADRELALGVMAERELGISPEAPADPRKDALVMGASYIGGGLVPLPPYLLLGGPPSIVGSIVLTVIALAVVGVAKARTAHRAVLPSVLEVVGIGAASGVLGYLLGDWLPRLLGLG